MALTAALHERETLFVQLSANSEAILANSRQFQKEVLNREKELAELRASLDSAERKLRREELAHQHTRMQLAGLASVPMARQAGSMGQSWGKEQGDLG